MRSLFLAIAMVVGGFSLVSAASHSDTEINKANIETYYEAWTQGDVDTIMGYFTDDIVYEDVATGALNTGAEAVRGFAQGFADKYKGVSLVPASVVIGHGGAAVEWVMSGGTGEEAWSVRGVCVLETRKGKISRATDYWDKK